MDSFALKLSFGVHHLATLLRVPFSRALPGIDERRHVKTRVLRPILPGDTHRACQARQASDIAAGSCFILQRNNMIDAAVDIVAICRKCTDWAARQARSVHTSVARM
jgi:hypothetical protein